MNGVLFLLYVLLAVRVPPPNCTVILALCLTEVRLEIFSVHLRSCCVNTVLSLPYCCLTSFLFHVVVYQYCHRYPLLGELIPFIVFSAFPSRHFAQLYWPSNYCSLVLASHLPSEFTPSSKTSPAIPRHLSAVIDKFTHPSTFPAYKMNDVDNRSILDDSTRTATLYSTILFVSGSLSIGKTEKST